MAGDPITLPPGMAIAILAFLLSLLPAGLFLWITYLRRHDRPVPISKIIWSLLGGAVLVLPALLLEQQAPSIWEGVSPATAHYFDGAVFPLQTVADLFYPAVSTFLIIAMIEEGLRYVFLRVWFHRSSSIDQVFDGLILGLTAGLGFATMENTLYFFRLFIEGSFDTLVFVFFLRFMVSTLAHISFGGIMGALLAKASFTSFHRGRLYWQAFLIPWFMHGLYDWLLGMNLSAYAVLMLLVPLLTLFFWGGRREFFIINRRYRNILMEQKAPQSFDRAGAAIQQRLESPWNISNFCVRQRRPAPAAHPE